MRSRYVVAALLSLVLAFAIPAAAHADTVDNFTLTLTGYSGYYDTDIFTVVDTFTLPATALPGSVYPTSTPYSFTFDNVNETLSSPDTNPLDGLDGPNSDTETFYNSASQGIETPNCSFDNAVAGCLVNFPAGDAQYFTLNGDGTLTFTPGTYDLSYSGDSTLDATLVIAAAPTPEPSSLLLLGTGLLSVAGAARRRFCSQSLS